MSEKLGYDEHLKTTNIPKKVDTVLATAKALLNDPDACNNPFINKGFKRGENGAWTRHDMGNPQNYVHLSIQAFRDGATLINFKSHRPLDHRFPEPPVDLNSVVQRRAYEDVSLGVNLLKYAEGDPEFETNNPNKCRLFPVLYPMRPTGMQNPQIYASSLNANENMTAAKKFEAAFDQFQESLFLTVSLLGLHHEAQERRTRSATPARAW